MPSPYALKVMEETHRTPLPSSSYCVENGHCGGPIFLGNAEMAGSTVTLVASAFLICELSYHFFAKIEASANAVNTGTTLLLFLFTRTLPVVEYWEYQ